VQVAISACFLIWVLTCFPRHLHSLPDSVRFPPGRVGASDIVSVENKNDICTQADKFRRALLISGTLRVFVQSSVIPIVALLMHDARWTGQFRQSIAVATFCLLQLPFQALASRICCVCSKRTTARYDMNFNRFLLGSTVMVLSAIAVGSLVSKDVDHRQLLVWRLMELAALVITLAVAAPFNASRLYQVRDAERAIVTLEWMKAYIGRLLGPFVAVMIYTHVGYNSLLACLCGATLVVDLTA